MSSVAREGAGSAAVHVHRRQFLVGPEPVRGREDWLELQLPNGLSLSHCPALPVERVGDWTLLGIAVQTDPDRPDPLAELAGALGDAEPRVSSWAGRWILLGRGKLRLDAAGTLGCFYRTVEGKLFASSSPELLRTLVPELARANPPLTYERGIDWYPPPESGVETVGRLLPSQILDLSGRVEPRRLVPPLPQLDYREILELLETRYRTELVGLARLHSNIWLALSSGRDSRLVLAAATDAGVPLAPFTFDLPRMTRGDLELPPHIARAAGCDHLLIEREPVDRERLAAFDTHTGRHVVDVAREAFGARQWEKLTGTLELAGGALSVGKAFYRRLPADPGAAPERTAEILLTAMHTAKPAGVRAWANWFHEHRDPSVDWRDTFYIDQRLGGWMSSINQGLDLNASARVHLGNSADVFSATLALPEEVRERFLHEEHMIVRMAPALAAFPFNPPSSFRSRVTGRVERERGLYRRHGRRGYVSGRVRSFLMRRSLRRAAEPPL